MEKEKTKKRKKNKRTFSGIVVSNKMDKTIVVRVETRKSHPLYKKIIKSHKKYFVHDEDRKYNIGDVVEIIETNPKSRKKRWIVVS